MTSIPINNAQARPRQQRVTQEVSVLETPTTPTHRKLIDLPAPTRGVTRVECLRGSVAARTLARWLESRSGAASAGTNGHHSMTNTASGTWVACAATSAPTRGRCFRPECSEVNFRHPAVRAVSRNAGARQDRFGRGSSWACTAGNSLRCRRRQASRRLASRRCPRRARR